MSIRTIARGLALAASLIAAALPPAAVTRTVCAQTGRAAIAWIAHDECALAKPADRPSCCDHDGDRPRPPREDDCCKKSPALTPTAPAATDDDVSGDGAALQFAARPAAAVPLPPARIRLAPRATGPPAHAMRRHLRARRVDVLTI